MASRTRVNQTSSNMAMATPILTFSAARAGILPRAMVIRAIAGRKSFASFISFIFSFSRGVLRDAKRLSRNLERQRQKRLALQELFFNSLWGLHVFNRADVHVWVAD